MNFREIIDAWIISFNPTDQQKHLAELRCKICDECLSKKHMGNLAYCGECGCPIGKKIFTNSSNPCDLKKWDKVDEPYFKKNKTLT